MRLRFSLLLSSVLAAAFLGVLVLLRPVFAAPPTSCEESAARYCVAMTGVRRSSNIAETTRYIETNEVTATAQVTETFLAQGSPVLTVTHELPPAASQTYYVEWPGLSDTFSGTAIIESDQPLTLQVIGPTALCPSPPSNECVVIQLAVGATAYTVANDSNGVITYTHQVYSGGELIQSFEDSLPPKTRKTYTIPNEGLIGLAALRNHQVVIQANGAINGAPNKPLYIPVVRR